MNEPPPPPPVPPPRRHAVTTTIISTTSTATVTNTIVPSSPSLTTTTLIAVAESLEITSPVPIPTTIANTAEAPLPTPPATTAEAHLPAPTTTAEAPLPTPPATTAEAPLPNPTTTAEAPLPTPPATTAKAPLPTSPATLAKAPLPTPTTTAAAQLTDTSPTSSAIAATCAYFASTTITLATMQHNPTAPAPKLLHRRKNLNGFENANCYKIRNVGDNCVIQLESGNKFVCMEEDDDKLELQLFRAFQQANGTFRIMAKLQKSPDNIQVWDYLSHRGLLLQKKQSPIDKFNQNWKSEPVPGLNSLYLIQSGSSPESQLCLKNMGIGQQIQLVTKDEKAVEDNFTHWYLELQD